VCVCNGVCAGGCVCTLRAVLLAFVFIVFVTVFKNIVLKYMPLRREARYTDKS